MVPGSNAFFAHRTGFTAKVLFACAVWAAGYMHYLVGFARVYDHVDTFTSLKRRPAKGTITVEFRLFFHRRSFPRRFFLPLCNQEVNERQDKTGCRYYRQCRFHYFIVWSIRCLGKTPFRPYYCIMSTLYVVATPIGNLEDITMRALRVLGEVGAIACEDTRHTGRLLKHFNIQNRLLSCRSANEGNSANGIVKLLAEGRTVAYVSDAGTPGISDPGSVVVEAVRQAGFPVVAVPGPSALSTLASVAGLSGKGLFFEGFLSPKKGKRRTRLKELLDAEYSFFLMESPFRIVKLMADLAEMEGERSVVIGREMTKVHEEYMTGTANELFERLSSRKKHLGEFSLLVTNKKMR